MRIGIDGSNLRSGGSITHLSEILEHGRPDEAGIDAIVVWGGRQLIERLPSAPPPWLSVRHDPVLDGSLLRRMRWKQRVLPRLLEQAGCDLLYVPAGACPRHFRPVVTMSRNMLPFEPPEYRRFGRASWMHWKMILLQRSQIRSFRAADGVIFLTEYARAGVTAMTGPLGGRQTIIPHGIDDRFRAAPRPQRPADSYSLAQPFKLLYVSKIDAPKHQWHLAEAVAELRRQGLPVALDLVGPTDWPPGLARLRAVLDRVDPDGAFIRHVPGLPHHELPSVYQAADAFVFASSCENMPNILIEAMAAGLPIATAERGPMPQIVGPHAAYFDPERPASIADALRTLFLRHDLREAWVRGTFQAAGRYSWTQCARQTFGFLAEVAGARRQHSIRHGNRRRAA